jgi:hypothetical protein
MEKIIRLKWSVELDRELSTKFENIEFLRKEVISGKAEAYQIDHELLIIVRPEIMPSGDKWELVWLASYGRNLLKHVPAILQRARDKNFAAIRFHCSHEERAVMRLVRRFGAEVVETISRYDLESQP